MTQYNPQKIEPKCPSFAPAGAKSVAGKKFRTGKQEKYEQVQSK